MADPWEILAGSRVDIPGVLGFVGQQRQRRMQEITFQRQNERQDRDDERQIKIDSVLARIYQPKGGDPASQSPTAAPTMPGAPQSGAPATLVDPSRLPPRTDGMQINPDALRELYAADPQTASQIQKLVYDADEQQLKKAQANGEAMATVAYRLKQLPAAERAGELQAWAPQLQQLGLSAEQLAQADLSDRGLDRYYATGRSLKDLVAERQPKFMAVPYGGDLVDTSDPNAVASFQGRQTGAPRQLTSKQEFDALPPGTEFIAPDGSHRVKPGGASPQGGATFP